MSAGFPPYPVPQDNAGCSTLTPLSWCLSFRRNLDKRQVAHVVIGRTSRSFPHSKPDVRLSPHPAFRSQPRYSRRAGQTRCLYVPGAHQGSQVAWPSTDLLSPVRPVDSCLEVTAGTPFAMRPVTSLLLPGGLRPVRPITGRRLATMPPPPSCPRAGIVAPLGPMPPRVKRCRTSHIPCAQTIEPLAACSTPGGLVTTRLAFEDQTPSTVPFGPGDSAVAPVITNDAHSQVSLVSIGPGFDT